MHPTRKAFILLLFSSVLSVTVVGQCRSFTKKECAPQLNPFLQRGQSNDIQLSTGEQAVVEQTFYSGQNYRLLACSQELEGVYFEVFNHQKQLIYTSKDADFAFWDFQVALTQTLQVKITVPGKRTLDADKKCVSFLVGFSD